jgi:hypothetical protein
MAKNAALTITVSNFITASIVITNNTATTIGEHGCPRCHVCARGNFSGSRMPAAVSRRKHFQPQRHAVAAAGTMCQETVCPIPPLPPPLTSPFSHHIPCSSFTWYRSLAEYNQGYGTPSFAPTTTITTGSCQIQTIFIPQRQPGSA